MPAPKFEPTISLGNLLMIVALLASVATVYATLSAQLARDDVRITALESARTANLSFQSTVLQKLTDISVDIGVLKSQSRDRVAGE